MQGGGEDFSGGAEGGDGSVPVPPPRPASASPSAGGRGGGRMLNGQGGRPSTARPSAASSTVPGGGANSRPAGYAPMEYRTAGGPLGVGSLLRGSAARAMHEVSYIRGRSLLF